MPYIRLSYPNLPPVDEILPALKGIFDEGWISSGRWVEELEHSVASYCEVDHAIAMSSGSAALLLLLKALDLKGKVLIPSFTHPSTLHSLLWNRLVPVLGDCRDETLTLASGEVRKASALHNISAVMAAYVFGCPPDMSEIGSAAAECAIPVVYDAAQGFGSAYRGRRAGSFGTAEVFSLSPPKPVTSAEGGVVCTADPSLASELRRLRSYGGEEALGLNAKLSEIQALIGCFSLAGIEKELEIRRGLAEGYDEMLSGIEGLRPPGRFRDRTRNWNYYSVVFTAEKYCRERDTIMAAMEKSGIETRAYLTPPCHELPLWATLGLSPLTLGTLEATGRAAAGVLTLPLHSHLKVEDVKYVAATFAEILGAL